jgi:hypothetical protein
MVLNNKCIISNIDINEEGHITINFSNNQYFIFTKENFNINKYNQNEGLIFTKNNKSFIVKMKGQNLDAIINSYNSN